MNRGIQFLIVPALAAALAACSATPEERAARAEAAFANGDFAAAKIDLTALMRETQPSERTLTMLAKSQLELRDGEGALVTLEKLAKLGDPEGKVAVMLADAELLRGRPQSAIERVEGVKTPGGARMRALAHIDLGDISKAREEFEAGAVLPGEQARLQADFARFLIGENDLTKARQLVASAKASAPAELEVLLASAMLAEADDDFAAAKANYERVLKGRPGNRAALVGRIAAMGELGDLAGVERELSQMGGDLSDPAIAFLTARLAAGKGDWAETRKILQSREFALRDDPEADLLYAESLMRSGQENQARARLASLARRYPDLPRARIALIQVNFALGDKQEGQRILGQIASDPEASTAEKAMLAEAIKAGDFTEPSVN